MANKIRVNNLLRASNISLGDLQTMFKNKNISPTNKLGILDEWNEVKGGLDDLSIEELIQLRSDCRRIIENKIETYKKHLLL